MSVSLYRTYLQVPTVLPHTPTHTVLGTVTFYNCSVNEWSGNMAEEIGEEMES